MMAHKMIRIPFPERDAVRGPPVKMNAVAGGLADLVASPVSAQ
jgi:hypothetical protein